MTREEELEAILKVRSGDVNAFEALVLEHQNKVYSLALRMVGNEEDARDMAQEAFIRAFNSLGGFRGESKFSVWLYRLTTNICIDFLRVRSKRPISSLSYETDDGEEGELEIPDERFAPERELDRRELRAAVDRGLAELSPEYRAILVLREINGLSYDEIARCLRLEEGTVKSRLFRARRKLSDYLTREGNIPGTVASHGQTGGEGA